jgi:hypothetical protein
MYDCLNRKVSLEFDRAVRITNPAPGGRGNPSSPRHGPSSLSASQPLPQLHVQNRFLGAQQVSHLLHLRHQNGEKLPKRQ